MHTKGLGRDVSTSISNATFLMLREMLEEGRISLLVCLFSEQYPLPSLSGAESWAKWSDSTGQRQMRQLEQAGGIERLCH